MTFIHIYKSHLSADSRLKIMNKLSQWPNRIECVPPLHIASSFQAKFCEVCTVEGGAAGPVHISIDAMRTA